jgi:uncharacterized protein (DUF1778 family)
MKKASKRGGKRPGAGRKPTGEWRSAHLHVRLTEEERDLLDKAAAILGLEGGSSELVRTRTLDYARQIVEKQR